MIRPVRIALAVMMIVAGAVGAQAQRPWYDGQTITYIVATAPGGGFDQYARLIAPVLEKDLPGSLVVVRNVPGAGQLVGAAELYEARPDGLTIGTFSTGLAYAQVAKAAGVKFDLAKLSWIGKAASDARVLLVRKDLEAKTFDELRHATTPLRFVTPGIGTSGHVETVMLTEAFGIPAKIIAGFSGSEGDAAIMKGEADAIVGSGSSMRQLVENGFARPLLVIGSGADFAGADVPQASALAGDEAQRQAATLAGAMADLQRVTAAPPGVAPDRLADLRAAYARALADPELLDAAARQHLPIEPLDGPAVGQRVADLLSTLAAQPKLFTPAVK